MTNPQSPLYSAEIVLKNVETIRSFIDKTAEILNKYIYQPMPNSRGAIEMASFADPSLVEDVYSRASLCLENAADHLMAFTDTLQEPAKTLSPYTCVRSLMDSCAIALWLLDLNIDVRERVARCFGYRYKEFVEQIKFFSANKVNPLEAQKSINFVQHRMTVVEAKAISLGYPKLTSKSGAITGIALHMPETIGLIKKTLDKESDYRLLSGIAHSYLWATRQVGFKVIETTNTQGKKVKVLEKCAYLEMILLGITLAVPTFAEVFWMMGKLFGWDMQEIEGLLNQTFDDLGFNNNVRFWCQP